MKLRSHLLAIISAILGLAIFIYVINQTGLDQIRANLQRLGAGFLLILALSSSRYLSRTAAWLRCMMPEERSIGFWALWRARLAGEAVGDLTFGPVVAEPLRLIALGDRLSLSSGISSLTVENIAYTISSCVMVMAGAVALLASFGLDGSLRAAMSMTLGIVFIVVASAVIVINRRWKIGSGIATVLVRILIRDGTRQGKIVRKIDRLRELEDYVFDFYSRRPVDFLLVALSEIAFHFAGILEIYATLRLIGIDLALATAFMLESVNRAINIAFIFVPALVGIDEMLTKLLTDTLGLGGVAGVTLALVRKIRMFFWIGIGLIFLAGAQRRNEVSNRQRG